MHRILGVALCFTALVAPVTAANRLSIDGSRTMYWMNKAMVQRFEKTHPGITVTVAENGTAKAFDSVARGKADMGAVTRDLRPEDHRAFAASRVQPILVPIALEGISIYVHPRNPVSSLTVQQVADIYSGAITNWQQVGGPDLAIHVHSFDDSTGRYWYMADDVMHRKAMVKSVRFTERFADIASPAAALERKEQQMLARVSADPAAIGFGDLKKIRVVKIVRIGITAAKAALPTPSDIKAGLYPFARTLSYLARQPLTGAAAEFIRWATAQEDLIRDAGFVPLNR